VLLECTFVSSAQQKGSFSTLFACTNMIYAGRNKLESARTTRQEGNNELSATVSNLARRWWRSKNKHSKGSSKETNSLMAVDTMKQQLTKVLSDDEALINKKLPKELLLRIFSYIDVVSLCRCAQVSKAWNVLALDGSNWQRIDLFDFQKDVEGPIIENISRRCGGFLRQLSLRGCQSIADGSMKTLAQLCPNVEDLNLNGCKKLTDASCTAFSKHCSKLQKLNLDSCSAITDNSLKALSDGCPNLTHINISWCSNITENGVEALARGCRKLKSFISKGCKQITSRAVICLGRFCDQLEVVNLLGCSVSQDQLFVHSVLRKCVFF
jgi:F-box/leucine-rich repeat protein 2/20